MKTWIHWFAIVSIIITGCSRPREEPAKGPAASSGGFRPRSVTEKKNDVPPDKVLKSKAKKNIAVLQPQGPDYVSGQANRDTAVTGISFMEYLRIHEINIDLNEPFNRSALNKGIENGKFPSVITLSPERYFFLHFDNDILNYTDRYYTNGILLELISPSLRFWPLNRLTLPYWNQGVNYYGVGLVQDMFTPSTTKVDEMQTEDRPYASCLYLASFKITNDPHRKLRIRNELQLGVIGPASLGEFIQTWTHQELPGNNLPGGWQYQIQNDLLLNEYLSFEKGLLASEHAEVNINASGSLGTVYTYLSGGTFMRIGFFNRWFDQYRFSRNSINRSMGFRKNQAYAFLNLNGRFVGYDATLQGGVFNDTSPYTLSASEVVRAQFRGSGGIEATFGGFSIKAEQFLISPEFKGGLWHKWVSIGIGMSF